MSQQTSIPFPLERLLAVLGSRGITVDTRQRIAVQRVLTDLGGWADVPTRKLARYIAPIVAKGPEEQVVFYAAWEEVFPAEVSEADLERLRGPEMVTRKTFWRRMLGLLRRWWWVLVGVLGLGFFLWVQLTPLEPVAVGWQFLQNGGRCFFPPGEDSVKFSPIEVYIKDSIWLGQFEPWVDGIQVRLRDQESYESRARFVIANEGDTIVSLRVRLSWLWRKVEWDDTLLFRAYPWNRPRFKVIPVVSGDRGVVFHLANNRLGTVGIRDTSQYIYKWDFGDGDSSTEAYPTHTYPADSIYHGTLTLQSIAQPDSSWTDSFTVDLIKNEEPTEVPDTNAIAALPDLPPLPQPPPRYEWKILWGRILVFSLGWMFLSGLGLWLMRWYIRRNEARALAERQARFRLSTDGPYNIPWPNQDHRIAWDEHLDRVAAVMAGRGVGERLHLDLPASIRATASAAGQPSLRFHGQGEALTWLVLVDEGSMSPFELRLVDWWLRRLYAETVQVDVYHFRDRPDHCWRPGKSGTVSIQHLELAHSRAYLIVIGRGDGLLQPFLNMVRGSVEEALRPWKRRTLLTPENPLEWAGRERGLSRLFGICPMESRLMLEYFLLPDVPMAEDHRAWHRSLLRHRVELEVPVLPRRGVDREALVLALGDGHLSRWILALHTYPEQIWEHAVASGARLLGEGKRLPWDDLWRLLRMPFLQEGSPIRKLERAAQTLTTAPEVRIGREVAVELLTEAQDILRSRGFAAGMAHTEIERERALQQYNLAPDGKEAQADIAAMQAEGVDVVAEIHKIKYPKWPFALPLLVLALVLGVALVLLPDREAAAPDKPINFVGDWLTDWDTVEAVDSVRGRFEDFYRAYDRGRQMYMDGEYTASIQLMDSAKVELGTYVTLVPDQALVDSFRYGLVTFFFDNAIGLSRFYVKDTAGALDSYAYIFRNTPDFFTRYAAQEPNLPSLLRQAGVLRPFEGRVRDQDGDFVEGALVQISSEKLGLTNAISDSMGHYELDYVPNPDGAGNLLSASLAGYQGIQVTLVGESVKDLVLKRLRCSDPKTQQVRVLSPEGQPVRVTRIGLPGALEWKVADAGVELRVCGEMPTTIRLWVEADGYVRLDTVIQTGGSVELRMPKGGTILSGTVTDELGAALPQYEIRIDGFRVFSSPASPRREFSVNWGDDIGRGNVRIEVIAPGFDTLREIVVLPALGRRYVLKRAVRQNIMYRMNINEKAWELEVAGYKGRPVPDFEVFVDGVSIRKVTGNEARILKIPRSELNGDKGTVKIEAAGFETKLMPGTAFSKTTAKMELHPEIKKLISDMVLVEGDTFMMGCTSEQGKYCFDNEKPAHQVVLDNYAIGRYEVTQVQWMALMGSNPSKNKGCERCPVENVTWNDCHVFLSRLISVTGMQFHLPTEAEWEFAARGGRLSRGTIYAGGNELDVVAWHDGNSVGRTHSVGSKNANEFGLFDMSGNVWEWCEDWYRVDYYRQGNMTNPKGPLTGILRVLRGGSWYGNSGNCRISNRGDFVPEYRDQATGFRVARD